MENGGGDSQPRVHRIIAGFFEIDQEKVNQVRAVLEGLENRQILVVAHRTCHALSVLGVPYQYQEILLSDNAPENSDA